MFWRNKVTTAKERECAFRRDLVELLQKHRAELEVTDDNQSYGMHRGIVIVTMFSEYDDDGEQTAEFVEFNI